MAAVHDPIVDLVTFLIVVETLTSSTNPNMLWKLVNLVTFLIVVETLTSSTNPNMLWKLAVGYGDHTRDEMPGLPTRHAAVDWSMAHDAGNR